MIKLYGAIKNDKLSLRTVRKTGQETWKALCDLEEWSNCFDMVFRPTQPDLKKDGWEVKEITLTWE